MIGMGLGGPVQTSCGDDPCGFTDFFLPSAACSAWQMCAGMANATSGPLANPSDNSNLIQSLPLGLDQYTGIIDESLIDTSSLTNSSNIPMIVMGLLAVVVLAKVI